ncbi:MAG: sigma-70 family RNA polymerase sigma factor [Burkholderiales bacterium]|nr:sigma-70 family RNA polymerase sigma factor [Burkholderiales bacterium]
MSAHAPRLAVSAGFRRHDGRDASSPAPAMAQRPPAPAAPVSDAVLVARVLAGDDRHAFAELTRRHQSAVRSLLRRLTRNDHALADDLAQDTFLQVYRNLRQFRGEAKFATWIYRIAYNAFLAHVRSAHPEDELPDQLPEDDSGPSLARASAMRMDLAKALAGLSEGERAAIVQCYYQDLSHEEAAFVLGCPLGTVKTNVLRAKQKLRSVLAAWSPARD